MISYLIGIFVISLLLPALFVVLPLVVLISRGEFRRVMIWTTLIYYLLCCSFFGAIYALRKPIFQGHLFPGLREFLFVHFAPSDLNEPLAKVLVSKGKKEFQIPFRCKYPGFYSIDLHFSGVVPQNLVDDSLQTKEKINIKITVKDHGRIAYENILNDPSLGYWSRDGSGISVYYFWVPKQQPIDRELEAFISIDGDLPILVEKYSPVYLIVERSGNKFAPTYSVPFFNVD